MKKLFLIYMFVFLTISGLFSESLPKKFYFPECQVQIPAPPGWYARDETQTNVGMVFVSKEDELEKSQKISPNKSFGAERPLVKKMPAKKNPVVCCENSH